MKIFCGFYKSKKSQSTKKNEKKVEYPEPSRVASTMLTQKSPKPICETIKLECFKNETILQNYDIIHKIGSGSFGEIYKVRSLLTNEFLAIKVEKKRPEKNLLLLKEKQILEEFVQEYGFPQMNSFIKGEIYSYLVMSFLGENLETLKKRLDNKFSIKTVIMVGLQILERIEVLHQKNFIHRDIKPENFVIGSGENYKTIYLIDFGLSKAYIENSEHIPFRDRKGMVGTARYASINTHLGIEQSRRDDLEAIGYILIYFVKGRLPWQNIYAKNKEQKYAQILSSKQKVTTEQLCADFPPEFVKYFEYVKNLGFTEKPDYKYLKDLFLTMMKNNNYKMDFVFDWNSFYTRNPTNELKENETKGNILENYTNIKIKPNNISVINNNNLESAKKLKLQKMMNKNHQNNKNKRMNEKGSLTSSNEKECDIKDEDDQIKIQETYNTMQPKLIKSSIKKMKRNADDFLFNFRGKHFLKFRKNYSKFD